MWRRNRYAQIGKSALHGWRLRGGEDLIVVAEMAFAGGEKVLFGGDAADFVEETTFRINPRGDEVHVFFHLLHVSIDAQIRRLHRFVEFTNVLEKIRSAWAEDRQAAGGLADLVEDPGVPNRAATDHQAASPSLFENAQRRFG